MGELHLEIIVDRLVREFKVQANVGKPQVAYRETIEGRLKLRQNMLSRPVVVVSMAMCGLGWSPLSPVVGLEFVNKIVGGTVPREYHRSSRKRC